MNKPNRSRDELLRDIREDKDAFQAHPLVADILMRILEVLIDMRDGDQAAPPTARGGEQG